jgi:hypothetical protein
MVIIKMRFGNVNLFEHLLLSRVWNMYESTVMLSRISDIEILTDLYFFSPSDYEKNFNVVFSYMWGTR